ncbi:MAG: hypothetical protein MJA27_24445 [Pseudanabaenales cyanobacterium]|nr:hypothetical protein [Pseudanabaenales cyanobacterium]
MALDGLPTAPACPSPALPHQPAAWKDRFAMLQDTRHLARVKGNQQQ